MRLTADSYLDVIKYNVRRNSPDMWLPAPLLASIVTPHVSTPEVEVVYLDETLTNGVPPGMLMFTKRMLLSCDDGLSYSIAAMIGPETPGSMAFFLTTECKIVLLCHTTTSRHQDGTVQIYGAKSGLTIFTPEKLKPQIGKMLMSGDAVRGFVVQERRSEGEWHNIGLVVPRGMWNEIALDDED